MLPGLNKELSNALGPKSNPHFIKVRACTIDKVACCLSSDCPREQRLTDARLPKQEHTSVQLSAFIAILFRLFDHFNQILNLFFDLINSFDIVESLGYVLGCLYFKLVLVSQFLSRFF